MQLTKQQVNYCMECWVWTGSCPISQERPEFIRSYRVKAKSVENLPRLSHNGMFQTAKTPEFKVGAVRITA